MPLSTALDAAIGNHAPQSMRARTAAYLYGRAPRHLIKTFFDGSSTDAVAAILDDGQGELSQDDLDRLERFIDEARKEGR